MIRLDTDLCFIDTETLGLDPAAPVWDFAAVRIDRDGHEIASESFLIEHDPGHWLDGLPAAFRADYRARYWAEFAAPARAAAEHIHRITDGAVIAGSNPSFDMLRLETLLRANGFEPGWHYHGLDIPSMVVGWLARTAETLAVLERQHGNPPEGPMDAPWKSDQLSAAIGVNPAQYERHTAHGDVDWCLAQWRAMTGQEETR